MRNIRRIAASVIAGLMLVAGASSATAAPAQPTETWSDSGSSNMNPGGVVYPPTLTARTSVSFAYKGWPSQVTVSGNSEASVDMFGVDGADLEYWTDLTFTGGGVAKVVVVTPAQDLPADTMVSGTTLKLYQHCRLFTPCPQTFSGVKVRFYDSRGHAAHPTQVRTMFDSDAYWNLGFSDSWYESLQLVSSGVALPRH